MNPAVRTVAKKWYKALGFPKEYDSEFEDALENISVSDATDVSTYDKKCKDGKRNLISYLFLCEKAAQKYKEAGLPEDVLEATLKDVCTWCISWSNVKGELYLGELEWLSRHLSAKLFRLGRLQYAIGEAEHDIPKYGVKRGDPVVEVHIPEGERLTTESCRESLGLARAFFKKHFPEYDYKCFTCHSWLLDEELKKYLPENSGIIAFGDMFDIVDRDESWDLIKYLFAWDTTPLNLKYRHPTSSLAAKIQKAVLSGEKFYSSLGVIEK